MLRIPFAFWLDGCSSKVGDFGDCFVVVEWFLARSVSLAVSIDSIGCLTGTSICSIGWNCVGVLFAIRLSSSLTDKILSFFSLTTISVIFLKSPSFSVLSVLAAFSRPSKELI